MPISVIIVTVLVCYFLGNHNGAICVSHMLHDDVRDMAAAMPVGPTSSAITATAVLRW